MRVSVLLLGDAFDTGTSTVLDTLAFANSLSEKERPPLRVKRVGVRRRIRTSLGFELALDRATGKDRPDIVIVPALGATTPETLAVALARRDVDDAGALLREWHAKGTKIAAACTSTFVLAKAGLLDGLRATTTWWLAPTLREWFPKVQVDESRMIIDAGHVITAGAALGHVDLALWLVRQRSPSLARLTARHLVFDERPSQAAYILPDQMSHTDPIVEKFEHWARRHLSTFSPPDAAKSVGTSERTLERRLQRVLGKSPVSYVRDLRVEQAVHWLQTTDESVDAIAARVGYEDGVTLRTLLRRKTGRGVRELRARE